MISQTDAVGKTIRYTYNPLGQKISFTDPKGGNAAEPYATQYSYDLLGNLICEETPFEYQGSTLAYSTNRWYYDANGRVIAQTVSSNAAGEAASERKTGHAYDLRGRLVTTIAYDGTTPDSYTCYTYDDAGNMTGVYTGLDAPEVGGASGRTYGYDVFGNVIAETDPLGNTESNVYDISGLLLQKTDRNGNVTDYAYDAMGRLLTSTAGSDTVSLSYTKAGHKKSEQNGDFTVSFTYDALGRLSSESESGNITKTYSYDSAGNRTAFVLKQGETMLQSMGYTYDAQNRLETVRQNNNLVATYDYDENGNRSSLTYPNGNAELYSYNLANAVTSLQNKQGSTVLSGYSYSYFLDGNQASKMDHTGKVTSYVYDDMGRLEQESEINGLTVQYGYDSRSNRLAMTVSGTENYTTNYTYDAADRLLTETKKLGSSDLVGEYKYDKNGNRISKLAHTLAASAGAASIQFGDGQGVELYRYDGFNRLATATVNGASIGYKYKPDGLRFQKTVGIETTIHIWDGQNMAAEINGSGALKANYLRGVNLLASEDNAGSRKYYLYNAHGDVVQLSNAQGNVVWTYDYDAFGNEKPISGQTGTDNNPFRYCGEYKDDETGSIYLRARYYDPVIGRFTQQDPHWNTANMIYGDNPLKINEREDPLGLTTYTLVPSTAAMMQSGNLYVYGMNNPILYVDKDGELAMLATMAIGAGLGGLISGGIELGSQLLSGRNWSDVQWGKVGIQAASGAASGALGGSGVGLIGQIAGNAAISSVSNMTTQKIYTGNINFAAVAKEAGIGALTGFVGGPGIFNGANKVHVTYVMEGSHLLRRTLFHYVDPKITQTAMKELMKGAVKGAFTDVTIKMIDEFTFEVISR